MTVKTFPAYVYSQPQIAGVVAAHNHMALTNPVGSGKLIFIGGVFVSSYTEGAVSGVDPLRGWTATSVSGGTLQDVSTITKMNSALPDPVGQIRVTGVTATLGSSWFNSPATRSTGSSSAAFVHQIPAALPGGGPLTLRPGESTVIRTEVGDTDQRWNISIAWLET